MQTPASVSPLAAPDSPQGDGRVLAAVKAAASATGISFEYLLAQANQESGLDPSADNSHSSAAGLFQFTASTWLDMIRRHGAKMGLDSAVQSIVKGADGHLHVANPATRKAILDLRHNPEISARMAAEYAKDNQRSLQAKLGRPVSAHDLTLAHFLGAGGAAKVLEGMNGATRTAAHLLPEAARANPDMFREAGSHKQRSVASLYHVVQSRFSGALSEVASMVRQQSDLASLRPEPRPDSATGESSGAGTQVAANLPAYDQPAPSPFATPVSASGPAAAESSFTPGSPFAHAVEPPSPFFPVPLVPRKV